MAIIIIKLAVKTHFNSVIVKSIDAYLITIVYNSKIKRI